MDEKDKDMTGRQRWGKWIEEHTKSPTDRVQEEINKNEILQEVQDLLITQTAKGLAKYPRTVHIDDYTLTEWIDHVLQEKTDEIVYLVTLKHKVKKVIG
ncbi:hypothetical protein LRR81_08750 [Metabacillus sp. GX 13764]|uniref:hypothetical protein n=1 Tax=Metabacillus kandeliae TaxID=2900151 RepID=UPI001E5D7447|nr:hypothetical protein [Metabacillus kandeliae]MCD7034322.1 hypothetical protein [Metabacillus kandeliae]